MQALLHADNAILVPQGNGGGALDADAVLGGRGALDVAVPQVEEVVAFVVVREHCNNLLVLFKRQESRKVGRAGGRPRFGNFVGQNHKHCTLIGKETHALVGLCLQHEQRLILGDGGKRKLPGQHLAHFKPLADADGNVLDNGEVFAFIHGRFVAGNERRPARCRQLAADFDELLFNERHELFIAAQNGAEFGNELDHLGVLALDGNEFHVGQALEPQIENRLRLRFRKAEGLHQAFARFLGGLGGADERDDRVQIVHGDHETG